MVIFEGKSCSSIEVLKTMNYIDYGEERYLRRHIAVGTISSDVMTVTW
jgi:hypothetical protein